MVYLDNNATTRIDPIVLEAMMPYLTDNFANAASSHHLGSLISNSVKIARRQICNLINCDEHEIIFTSGATESINLSIKGICENYTGRHIVTVKTEHTAVIDVCCYLEKHGYEVTYLPVQPDGLLKIDDLRAAVRSDTVLVSVMLVNNETGVVQPIKDISTIAHEVGALFMTDATQAVGKMPIDVEDLDIDLMPFSAHKFYGPKGVGGLFVRQRSPRRVQLTATIHGGGHERELRSGTLNVPGIIGMGQACELARQVMADDARRINELRYRLEATLLDIKGTFINGSQLSRLYNVTNITLPNTDANVLIGQLKTIAVSNGSACSSAVYKPSHVLKAMGLTDDEAFGAIRFSLGRFTTESDIFQAAEAIKQRIYAFRH
ncbi:cysteine desulfurase family protein [Spirosoma pomorum]